MGSAILSCSFCLLPPGYLTKHSQVAQVAPCHAQSVLHSPACVHGLRKCYPVHQPPSLDPALSLPHHQSSGATTPQVHCRLPAVVMGCCNTPPTGHPSPCQCAPCSQAPDPVCTSINSPPHPPSPAPWNGALPALGLHPTCSVHLLRPPEQRTSNRVAQITELYSFTALEAGSPRSGIWQGAAPSATLGRIPPRLSPASGAPGKTWESLMSSASVPPPHPASAPVATGCASCLSTLSSLCGCVFCVLASPFWKDTSYIALQSTRMTSF